MITKFEEKNEFGATYTIYDTDKATYARKTRSLVKEFGCDSDEYKQFREEKKNLKPLTVGEVIDFLNALPRETTFVYRHDSGIVEEITNIETKFTFDESEADEYEPKDYVTFY